MTVSDATRILAGRLVLGDPLALQARDVLMAVADCCKALRACDCWSKRRDCHHLMRFSNDVINEAVRQTDVDYWVRERA